MLRRINIRDTPNCREVLGQVSTGDDKLVCILRGEGAMVVITSPIDGNYLNSPLRNLSWIIAWLCSVMHAKMILNE